MLATSSGFGSQIVIGVVVLLLAALVTGIARASKQTVQKRQRVARDNQSLTEFFFDTPQNPHTKVPAREGWTTRVDRSLEQLATSVAQILSEVKPDGNGGHNLRGEVRRAAEAATTETDRIHRNEQ